MHVVEDRSYEPRLAGDAEEGGGDDRHFLHCINLVRKRDDPTVRRGAIVKAMCICSRFNYIEVRVPAAAAAFFCSPGKRSTMKLASWEHRSLLIRQEQGVVLRCVFHSFGSVTNVGVVVKSVLRGRESQTNTRICSSPAPCSLLQRGRAVLLVMPCHAMPYNTGRRYVILLAKKMRRILRRFGASVDAAPRYSGQCS